MDDYQKYNQLIQGLRQDVVARRNVVQSQIITLQSELHKLAMMEDKLKALDSEFGLTAFDVEIYTPDTVVVADGKPLSADKIRNLPQEYFDVILDIFLQSLWVRVDPKVKSELIKCDIKRWRGRKRRLLAYMLKNPEIAVGLHNIHRIYQDDKHVSSNTLAQMMRSLRTALHQINSEGPYILNTTVWDKSHGIEEFIGNGYIMSDQYHYLVILENFKNHQDFIAKLIEKS